MTQPDRIEKLMAVIAVAMTWACLTGKWVNDTIQTIPVRNHGYKENSFFRAGLDFWDRFWTKLVIQFDKITDLINRFVEIMWKNLLVFSSG